MTFLIRCHPWAPHYKVTSQGQVLTTWKRSGGEVKQPRFKPDGTPYMRLYLPPEKQDGRPKEIERHVRRIVAETFPDIVINTDKLDSSNKYVLINLDGNLANNAASNLRVIPRRLIKYHDLWLQTGITRKTLKRFKSMSGPHKEVAQKMSAETQLPPLTCEHILKSRKYADY